MIISGEKLTQRLNKRERKRERKRATLLRTGTAVRCNLKLGILTSVQVPEMMDSENALRGCRELEQLQCLRAVGISIPSRVPYRPSSKLRTASKASPVKR